MLKSAELTRGNDMPKSPQDIRSDMEKKVPAHLRRGRTDALKCAPIINKISCSNMRKFASEDVRRAYLVGSHFCMGEGKKS